MLNKDIESFAAESYVDISRNLLRETSKYQKASFHLPSALDHQNPRGQCPFFRGSTIDHF